MRIERRRQLRADALRQLRLRIARHTEHEPRLRFVVLRDVLVGLRAAALQFVVRDVNRARHRRVAAAIPMMAIFFFLFLYFVALRIAIELAIGDVRVRWARPHFAAA